MSAKPELSPLTRRLMQGSQPSPATGRPLNTLPHTAPARKRTKLWELADKHHCPIIGTCLSMADLVRLARRFSFAAPVNNEYALHVEAVGYCRERNGVSETIQRLLDKKYEAAVKRFAAIREEGKLSALWKSCLAKGEVAGPLWAAYTHKLGSAETRQAVYGDIHMLSHQVGAGQAADARRLQYLEVENKALRQSAEENKRCWQAEAFALQDSRRLLSEQLAEHAADLADLRQACQSSSRRLAEFESGQVMVDLGRKLMDLHSANDQLIAAAQRVWAVDRSLKSSQEENAALRRELETARAEKQAMVNFVSALADAEANCPDASAENCSGCENALSPRCILYVGGRASMIAHYRQLSERLGIRLMHHDGGLEESLSRLPELIHGVDAVLCPTDNISHAAYYQVKSHCKRVGKPCLFYKGSGVSSFAAAMDQVARQEFSLGAASGTRLNSG